MHYKRFECGKFSVVDTQLYERLCLFVCWSVGLLCMVIELKSGKISVLDTFVYVSVLGVGWGVDWG